MLSHFRLIFDLDILYCYYCTDYCYYCALFS